MKIGTLEIKHPVLLAPMAAVTDLPFRTICEEHGVGLTITEFLSAHALKAGASKTVDKMTPSLFDRPFGVQIFGRDVNAMITGATMACTIGASLIDINMGCPAKRVVAGACGSALMKEPTLAQELVSSIRQAIPEHIPITVKHRSGWDATSLNAPEFACAMVEAGACMITVHGRSRKQGFSGSTDLSIIRRVREAVPVDVPVVGNGDVTDVERYRQMKEETGCDAVMIGRGAMGNPWLFRRIVAIESGNIDPGPPTCQERVEVFQRHVELLYQQKSQRLIHEIRKASAWYAKGLYGANKFRQKAWSIDDCELLVTQATDYLKNQSECAA